MKRILAAVMLSMTTGAALLTAQTLTMDSCVSLALENNRKMASSRLESERYSHLVKAYRANFLPNFKLTANDIYSNADGTFTSAGGYLPTFVPNPADGSLTPNVLLNPATGAPVMSADGVTPVFNAYAYHPDVDIDYKVGNILQAGLTLEQPIYMGGKVTAAYRMARLGERMAALGQQVSEQEVIVSTQEAYVLLVHATEMLDVAQQYDSLLVRLGHDVEAAKRHGMASNNDLLKVRVKQSEARLGVRKAENGIRLAQMNLCHVIGWPLTAKPLPEELKIENGELKIDTTTDNCRRPIAANEAAIAQLSIINSQFKDHSQLVSSRPEYTILDLKTELAAEQVRLERSEFLPQVALLGAYNYLHGVKVNDDRLFDNSTSFAVMLNVSVPLFHFGEGAHKVKAARREAERARLEQEDLVEMMMLELTRAANDYDEAVLEVGMTGDNLAASAENLRASRKAYDVGYESLSDLLEAQTLWQQAYAKLVDARCQRRLAASRLLKAAGRLEK